jgi:hypothetical protein
MRPAAVPCTVAGHLSLGPLCGTHSLFVLSFPTRSFWTLRRKQVQCFLLQPVTVTK